MGLYPPTSLPPPRGYATGYNAVVDKDLRLEGPAQHCFLLIIQNSHLLLWVAQK